MQLQANIPLSQFTTLNIGGPAKMFCRVNSIEDLKEAVNLAKQQSLPYLITGGGSNLLVADSGTDSLVIKNEVRGIKIKEAQVVVQSGTILQDLVDMTVTKDLSGIHKLTGIPGTVGGAIYGNAGAYGQQISDFLQQVVCFDPQTLHIVTLSKDECRFGYRDSGFKKSGLIILEAHLQFPASQGDALQEEAQEIFNARAIKYPSTLKCPGSFFKNVPADTLPESTLKLIPPEKILYGKIPAGYLLEEVGAKGQKLVNIQVSLNHANLFINLGGGTAADFYQLAKTQAQKVREKFYITLEPEVQLINLPSIIDT